MPEGDLVVSLVGFAGRIPPPEVVGNLPIQLPRSGTVEVQIKIESRKGLENIEMDLDEPPKGISLEKFTFDNNLLKLVLKTDVDGPAVGTEGNLIVEIYTDLAGRSKETKAQKKRLAVGVLPAIPFRITAAAK
jgi:hypothetical protein